MVWLVPGKEIAPLVYTIDVAHYKERDGLTSPARAEAVAGRLETIGNLWGDWRGWWVSGSVNIAWQTQTFPRLPSNLDVVVLAQRGLLQFLIERAREDHLFLFRRTRSAKWPWQEVKHEKYVPVSLDYFMEHHQEEDRNWAFCRVDMDGDPEAQQSMTTRIRIYPHYEDQREGLISGEDHMPVDPSFLSSKVLFKTSIGRCVHGVDLQYLWKVQLRMLGSFRWRRNTKHRRDAVRIRRHLFRQGIDLYGRKE